MLEEDVSCIKRVMLKHGIISDEEWGAFNRIKKELESAKQIDNIKAEIFNLRDASVLFKETEYKRGWNAAIKKVLEKLSAI